MRKFASNRSQSLEARLRQLEDWAQSVRPAENSADTTGGGATAVAAASGVSASPPLVLAGDVTGPASTNTVTKAQHTTLPVAVSPTDDEKFLRYQDSIPAYELAFVALAGDVSGTNPASVVDKLKGQAVTAGTVSGQVLDYIGGAWIPTVIALVGDVSGAYNANTTDKAKGIALPTPAAADDGEVLYYKHSGPAYELRTTPFKQVAKTADYVATNDDLVIFVDATAGNVTITLPPVTAHKAFVVKKIDATANTVTIDGDAAETIEGAATYVIVAALESAILVGTATQWWRIAS